jgi:phage terminase large subunit-like protein
VPYDTWARDGYIRVTDGNVVDYDEVRSDINDLATRFNIREIAIDRWNSTQLQTQLMGDGLTVVPFGQGFASMTAPTKELERLVLERKLRHGGHPVLRWMASNVSVKQDPAGNLKIDKAKSTERVDGMVALAMAVGRAIVSREEDYAGVTFINVALGD